MVIVFIWWYSSCFIHLAKKSFSFNIFLFSQTTSTYHIKYVLNKIHSPKDDDARIWIGNIFQTNNVGEYTQWPKIVCLIKWLSSIHKPGYVWISQIDVVGSGSSSEKIPKMTYTVHIPTNYRVNCFIMNAYYFYAHY